MRKVLLALVLAGAAILGVVGASSAAGQRCLHIQYCPGVHPIIKVHTLPTACKHKGSSFVLPNVNVSDDSGIKVITIKLGSKTLLNKKFSGRGPLTYTVKGLRVHTTGLSKGAHSIKISVKDEFGVSSSKTLRFTICPPPKFTG